MQPARPAGRGPRRQPDPFARSNGPLRRRVQPGHAHRRARRARRPLRAAGRAASARSSPARCSSTAATSTSTREAVLGSRLDPRHPGLRHPAGLRHRPGGRDPGRQQDRARARSTSGIAGGVDTTSDAPLGVNEDLRRILLEAQPRQDARRPAARRSAKLRPGQPRAGHPAQRRAAHRAVDGRARRDHRAEWGIDRARPRTSWPPASHQHLAAAYDRGFFDDLVTPYLGLDPRPEPAPGLHAWRSSPRSSRCSARADGRRR